MATEYVLDAEKIKDDAHWFIETCERESWCEEVTRLGRQL